MGRTAKTALALALCTAGALVLASCGGEDAQLLPGETAREITANLDKVGELSNEGDCVGAESAAREIGEQIDALSGVDQKLKRALVAGAERLNEVIAECEEATPEAAEPTVPAEIEEEASKEKPGKEKGKEKEKGKKPSEGEPGPPSSEAPSEPSLPPQANGEGKGPENGTSPGSEGEEVGPSGGVSPGSPAGEGN